MFAGRLRDLVGFTQLAERLDAEDVAAIQQAYSARSRQSLVRHGGLVEKFIGDAVVGSFGVARAQPADTSGLAQSELQVRVGVNTGEVLITGASAQGRQLTGDVVSVTARLQSSARPGSVLVGPETALAVESTMVLEPLSPVVLKGRQRRRCVGGEQSAVHSPASSHSGDTHTDDPGSR